MSRYPRIPLEKKEAILRRIKAEGVAAHRAATEAGISPKTVYNWLTKETEKSGVSWSEYNRMRRENEQLKMIVGELSLNLKRTKKN